MTPPIIDIVNFNSDASCLSTEQWLADLSGGRGSRLCRLLDTYVSLQKKVVLGITGATVADMHAYNPESIDLINRHPDIFQLILRPFSHDIALLRSPEGFTLNLSLGIQTIRHEFDQIAEYFLPPEFMLTSEQVHALAERLILGTFICQERFSDDVQRRLPRTPYRIRGIFGAILPCIPCSGIMMHAYLHALHHFDPGPWNEGVAMGDTAPLYSWRDGESPLLFPNGVARERCWLAGESETIERQFLSNAIDERILGTGTQPSPSHHTYPIHSFTAWMKEFRMLWFVRKIFEVEKSIANFSTRQTGLWLQAINSDVLSSIEKAPVSVDIKPTATANGTTTLVLERCDRGFEGTDCLAMLEKSLQGDALSYLANADAPHIDRTRKRIDYLKRIT